MDLSSPDVSTDLRDFLRVLRAHKWSIGFLTVALTGIALFFSFRETPIYTARTKVYVQTFSGPIGGGVDLQTERELVSTAVVAEGAAKGLGTTRPPGSLLAGLSVQVVPDTQILLIQYSAPSP